jgi:hypothetical protein
MNPPALLAKVLGLVQHGLRDDLVPKDPLLVIDVVDEQVQRGQALDQTGLDGLPFAPRDDPGQDIEGPGPVDVLPLAVDGEADPHLQDRMVRRLLAGLQFIVVEGGEVVGEAPCGGPGLPRGGDQFVIERSGIVGLPVDGHPGRLVGGVRNPPYSSPDRPAPGTNVLMKSG